MSGLIWVPGGAEEEAPEANLDKPWISENQLHWVANHIPDDGTFMEWGAGGSSVWFTEHLPETVTRIIIESDHSWARQVREAGTPVQTPTKESWSKGHDLDCSCFDPNYICRPEVATADVILVDGFNRSHCIAWVSHMARPGTVVFLHDYSFKQLLWLQFLPCWERRETMESDGTNNPCPMGRLVLK